MTREAPLFNKKRINSGIKIILCLVTLLTGTFGYALLRESHKKPIHYNINKPRVSFISLGDQGTGNFRQLQVAKAMDRLSQTKDLDFVMMLGDNFYPRGVESVEDPQWRYKFENMYTGEKLDRIPFYAVLGNHDYNGNEQAEIAYSRDRAGSGRWNMPNRDYTEYYGFVGDQSLVKVIYLDTSPYSREHKDTVNKLSRMLEYSGQSVWTIVASHAPVRTGSPNYYDPELVDLIVPVLKKYNVDVYFSGHDHNQQLIKKDGEPLFIVSGTGGKHGKPLEPGFEPDLKFDSTELGFVYSHATKDALNIEFYNSDNQTLYKKTLHQETPHQETLHSENKE